MSDENPFHKWIGTGIAALTLVVTASGLFWIARQLEQAQASLISSTSEHLYSRMHDIHKLFIEKPELRAYFYEGKEKPTAYDDPIRYAEVSQAAEMLCDFFHQVILELETVPADDRNYKSEMYRDLAEGWTSYIKDVYKRSPAFREHYRKNRSWYTSSLAMKIFAAADHELDGDAKRQSAKSPAP